MKNKTKNNKDRTWAVGDTFRAVYGRTKYSEWRITEITDYDAFGDSFPYRVVCIKGNGQYKVGHTTNFKDDGDMIKLTSNNTMTKFYRLKKDHPGLEVGAVLSNEENSKEYAPINNLFLKTVLEGVPFCEMNTLVENSPEWFERVYPVSLLTKTVYKVKAEARELFTKEHNA